MSHEYSLAHLTVMGLAPPEMIYVAARAGYDYVSIRPIYMGLPGEPDYALAVHDEHVLEGRPVGTPDPEDTTPPDGGRHVGSFRGSW